MSCLDPKTLLERWITRKSLRRLHVADIYMDYGFSCYYVSLCHMVRIELDEVMNNSNKHKCLLCLERLQGK